MVHIPVFSIRSKGQSSKLFSLEHSRDFHKIENLTFYFYKAKVSSFQWVQTGHTRCALNDSRWNFSINRQGLHTILWCVLRLELHKIDYVVKIQMKTFIIRKIFRYDDIINVLDDTCYATETYFEFIKVLKEKTLMIFLISALKVTLLFEVTSK